LKMSPGVQNMKMGPDALCTAENVSGSAKHENDIRHPTPLVPSNTWKRHPTPSKPSKTSPGAQSLKTGHDAHRTVENMSGSAK
jgi:hypothetical protein